MPTFLISAEPPFAVQEERIPDRFEVLEDVEEFPV
jgi:hypothetical protein